MFKHISNEENMKLGKLPCTEMSKLSDLRPRPKKETEKGIIIIKTRSQFQSQEKKKSKRQNIIKTEVAG